MSATRLPELQRALVAAAAQLDAGGAAAAPARRRRRMPAGRVLLIAVLTLLAAAAITVAATGVLKTGSDVAPRSSHKPRAKVAFGIPAGRVAPPIRVSDPRGGELDWGLRTFTTTRGFACVQLGRLQGDELGVVGRYTTFHDDGLFHRLPALVFDRADCVPVDASGHGFVAEHFAEMPITGTLESCTAARIWALVRAKGGTPLTPACEDDDLRTVDFGLLGPQAKSITYRLASGAHRTALVAAGTGAFLIVTPYQRPRTIAPFSKHYKITDAGMISQTPAATTIISVAYADGSVCRVRHVQGVGGGCPAKGFERVKRRLPSHAAVATPASAHIDRDGRRLHIAFRARLAAKKTSAAYNVQLYPPSGCGATVTGHPIARDVAAGQRVGVVIALQQRRCSGSYRVELQYRLAVRRPIAGLHLRYPGTTVDTLDVPIP